MANVIKHKRGTSDPSPSDLVVGEIGIRTDVGKLFTKTDSGTVSEIAGGGSDIIINTLSSSSATGGGSATFNGSAYRFTLSQPPSVSAQQLLVSIAGVIQKPVAGSNQPSEGFSVSGNDIILASAPATGTDFFILTFKSLGVSEPADNTVTSAKIVDGAIVNADINASAAIAGTKISPDFGSQNITTTGNVDAGSGQFRLNDSGRIRLGSAQDFEIYHDGSNSLIKDAGTGALVLSTNQLLVRNAAVNEFLIQAVENAGVKLYYDNSKKLETTSTGVTVTGDLVTTGHVQIPDNFRLKVGNATNGDLILIHDGTDSIIDNSTGNLFIRSDSLHLQSIAAENMVVGEANGAVELYYDNSKKLQTQSGGVRVFGDLENHNNNFVAKDDAKFTAGNSADLQIYHQGTVSRIQDVGVGGLEITSDGTGVDINKGLSEYMARFITDGAVELYYNNNKKFETTSDGIRIDAGEAGEAIINFFADEGDDANDKYRIVAQDSGDLVFQRNNGSAFSSELRVKSAGGVQANYQGSKKFETVSGGATITGTCTATSFSGDGSNLTGISGTTINSNSDNRVITGSGTANTLNAESTFVHDPVNCDTQIIHNSNNVADLLVQNTGSGTAAVARLTLHAGSNANAGCQLGLIVGSHSWYLETPKNAGNLNFMKGGQKFRMGNDGDFTISDGDLVIGTSGHGIDFSATSNSGTSELFDDYEEGSWTPTVASGGSGIATITATYTKTGRVVHVQFRGYLTGLNGNIVQIGGLPYSNLNNTHNVAAVMHNGFDYAGGTEPVAVSYISGTNSKFELYFSQTNSNGWTGVTGNNTNGAQFITSLKYFTS